MNQQQLTLTRLLGKKELSFGCLVRYKESKYFHKMTQRIGETLWGQTRDNACIPTGGQTKTEIGYHIPKTGTQVQLEIDEIIGHPATETDFKRWMIGKGFDFTQGEDYIFILKFKLLDNGMFADFISEPSNNAIRIKYDSSKDLLEQSPETLTQIIELITNTK